MKTKPCPPMDPRLPDDDRFPNGQMESNRDFAGHNSDWLEWCEANACLIAEATVMRELLSDIAYHISHGTLHGGSLIFAEDKPALEVIKASLARATPQPTPTPCP